MFDSVDLICEISSVRTVRIGMFDRVVRTLSGVRYIPMMHRNLVSLGVLESKGCGYSARGVMKVTRTFIYTDWMETLL